MPVWMNPKKWATAINGQSPDPSLNLSLTFDGARDKNRRNNLIINKKLIIKTLQMYAFKI
jgi:hypothetical protein